MSKYKYFIILNFVLFFALIFNFNNSAINYANAYSFTEINCVADFLNIKNNSSQNYVLKIDLDFSGVGANYIPFEFSGKIDGNGKTIKNLNVITENNYAGIFSKLTNASIKNLKIENCQIYGIDKVGVLAGKIENSISSNVDFVISNNYIYGATVGIIAGLVMNSSITNVYTTDAILNGQTNSNLCAKNANSNISKIETPNFKNDVIELPNVEIKDDEKEDNENLDNTEQTDSDKEEITKPDEIEDDNVNEDLKDENLPTEIEKPKPDDNINVDIDNSKDNILVDNNVNFEEVNGCKTDLSLNSVFIVLDVLLTIVNLLTFIKIIKRIK